MTTAATTTRMTRSRVVVVAALVLAVCLALATATEAATIVVKPSSPAVVNDIQDALRTVVDGDVVQIPPGRYTDCGQGLLIPSLNFTLRGSSSVTTQIDCEVRVIA